MLYNHLVMIITKRTTSWFCKAILAVTIAVILLLGLASVLITYGFPQDFGEFLIRSANKELLHSFLCTLVLGTGLLALTNNINLTNSQRIRLVSSCVTFVVALVWCLIANVSPQGDSLVLLNIADATLHGTHGDYSYLNRYPFQGGFLLYLYLMCSIFGAKNYIAFRMLNILCVTLIVFVLALIAELVSNKKEVGSVTAILTTLFLPLAFLTTFMYGNVPSFLFCLVAAWQALVIVKKKGENAALNLVFLCISLFAALWFKLNASIFFIAIGMWFAILGVKDKKLFYALPIVLIVVVYFAVNVTETACVKLVFGDIPLTGSPTTSWLVMGLQEGSRAPGWYNDYGWNVWDDHNGDVEAISAANAQAITERLHTFMEHPRYALHFFGKKTLTQWCEPTFQSLWTSFCAPADVFNDPDNPLNSLNSTLLKSFRDGKARTCYEIYCDALQTLIYITAFFGLVKQHKERNFSSMLIAIAFLGGFAYFFLFEGKTMYVLPYFVLLIPFASASFYDFYRRLT